MHGSIALANLLYALPSNTTADIEKAFETYKAERIGPSIDSFRSSQLLSKLLEKNFVGALLKFVMRNLPGWIAARVIRRTIHYRPTVGFLPKVENKGSVPAELSP
ncbi:hypothetical protein BGX29_005431, partial [Mortierella sp. GBA35]